MTTAQTARTFKVSHVGRDGRTYESFPIHDYSQAYTRFMLAGRSAVLTAYYLDLATLTETAIIQAEKF